MNAEAGWRRVWKIGAVAGLCGGAAEMAWVASYSAFTGTSGIAVAGEVATSVAPAVAAHPAAPLLGITIHMLLSVLLGVAFAVGPWRWLVRRVRGIPVAATAAATLAVVWTVNFLVVLPAINPAFVTLMPFAVTFASKLLFALAMAGVLHAARSPAAGRPTAATASA